MNITNALYKVETGTNNISKTTKEFRPVYLDMNRLGIYYAQQLMAIMKLHLIYTDTGLGTYFCVDNCRNIVVIQLQLEGGDENIESILYTQCANVKHKAEFIYQKLAEKGIPSEYINIGGRNKNNNIIGYALSDKINTTNARMFENCGYELYFGKPTLFSNGMLHIRWITTKTNELPGHYTTEVYEQILKWQADKIEENKRKALEEEEAARKAREVAEAIANAKVQGSDDDSDYDFSTTYKECNNKTKQMIDQLTAIVDSEGCESRIQKTNCSIVVGDKTVGSIILPNANTVRLSCDADDSVLSQFDEVTLLEITVRNNSKTRFDIKKAKFTQGVGNVKMEITDSYRLGIAKQLLRKTIQLAKHNR